MGKGFPRSIHLFFFVVFTFIFTTSCTHIRYESEGFIPLHLTTRVNHRHKAEISGVKEFYLWGRVHPDDHVFMDDEFYKEGFLSVGNIEVHQYQSIGQFFAAFFSLGFYIPISYRVSGMGAKEGD